MRCALVSLAMLVSATASAQMPSPWVMHELPDRFRDLTALACADDAAFARSWQGPAARFDGTAWSSLDRVPGGDVGRNLWVDPAGTVLFTTVRDGIARWSEGSWTRVDAPIGSSYTDQIWSADGTYAFAVGRARVVAWEHDGYAAFSGGTWRDLGAIFGFAEDDLWVGGELGTVFHFDGTTLTPHVVSSEGSVRRIWGPSSNDLWATVEYPAAVFHWDGSEWTERSEGLGGPVSAVSGSTEHVYAVGSFGVLRWQGARWRDVYRVEVDEYSLPQFVDVCETRTQVIVAEARRTWVRARPTDP